MGRVLKAGLLWGLLWGGAEALAAAPSDPWFAWTRWTSHVGLGLLAVVAAAAVLQLPGLRRWRHLASALAVGCCVLLIVFCRLHLAFLTGQPWTSPAHLLALLAGATAGWVAGAVVRFAGKRRRDRTPGLWACVGMGLIALLCLRHTVFSLTTKVGIEILLMPPGEGEWQTPPPAGPSLLLITVDTLRRDHVTQHAAAVATSSVLDRFGFFAVDGLVSTSSWTKPATASLLTGWYPATHTANFEDSVLPADVVTLTERLAAARLVTGYCVANPNASGLFGLDQGAHYSIPDPARPPHRLQGTTIGEMLRLYTRPLNRAVNLNGYARRFLEVVHGRRFFLYVHYNDPHTPYSPRPADLQRFAGDYDGRVFTKPRRDKGITAAERDHVVARYDAEVYATFQAVAELLDDLQELGLLDDTLVVLTADHGEEFEDHGDWEHGNTVYEEQVKLPCLVRLPGGIKGRAVRGVCSLVDIVPTVLDFLDLPAVPDLPGRSLRSWWEGGPPGSSTPLLVDCPRRGLWSLQRDHFKIIARTGSDGQQQVRLFDLDSDPGELRNLARQPRHAALVAELVEEAEELRRSAAALAPPDVRRDLGSALERQLRDLGYLREPEGAADGSNEDGGS